MKQYQDLIKNILINGEVRTDRTGVGTTSLFGQQSRYNLEEGFPLVTIKKTNMKAIIAELLWFFEGSTDERRLAELTYMKPRQELTEKRTIWTDNADNQGVKLGYQNNDNVKELGSVYGQNLRNFNGVDQLKWLVNEINTNPDSRRLVISFWNPVTMDKAALPPCHSLFQFYVSNGKLSCQLYQRSADTILGVPFNVASYALFTHIVAAICGLGVGDFVHTIGDAHIYNNHIDGAKELLNREPYDLPKLHLSDRLIEQVKSVIYQGDIFEIDIADDVEITNYQSHPYMQFKMAV